MPAASRPGFPVFEAWREIIAETLPAAARTKSIRSIRVPVGATNGSGPLEFTEPGFPALIQYSSNSSSAIGYKKRVGRSLRQSGGGGGIRTPGTLAGSTVFKTARFDRSRTPPFPILAA